MSKSNPQRNPGEAAVIPEQVKGQKSPETGKNPGNAGNAFERADTPILEVRDLCHRYPHLEANALDNINLKVYIV